MLDNSIELHFQSAEKSANDDKFKSGNEGCKHVSEFDILWGVNYKNISIDIYIQCLC